MVDSSVSFFFGSYELSDVNLWFTLTLCHLTDSVSSLLYLFLLLFFFSFFIKQSEKPRQPFFFTRSTNVVHFACNFVVCRQIDALNILALFYFCFVFRRSFCIWIRPMLREVNLSFICGFMVNAFKIPTTDGIKVSLHK